MAILFKFCGSKALATQENHTQFVNKFCSIAFISSLNAKTYFYGVSKVLYNLLPYFTKHDWFFLVDNANHDFCENNSSLFTILINIIANQKPFCSSDDVEYLSKAFTEIMEFFKYIQHCGSHTKEYKNFYGRIMKRLSNNGSEYSAAHYCSDMVGCDVVPLLNKDLSEICPTYRYDPVLFNYAVTCDNISNTRSITFTKSE